MNEVNPYVTLFGSMLILIVGGYCMLRSEQIRNHNIRSWREKGWGTRHFEDPSYVWWWRLFGAGLVAVGILLLYSLITGPANH